MNIKKINKALEMCFNLYDGEKYKFEYCFNENNNFVFQLINGEKYEIIETKNITNVNDVEYFVFIAKMINGNNDIIIHISNEIFRGIKIIYNSYEKKYYFHVDHPNPRFTHSLYRDIINENLIEMIGYFINYTDYEIQNKKLSRLASKNNYEHFPEMKQFFK